MRWFQSHACLLLNMASNMGTSTLIFVSKFNHNSGEWSPSVSPWQVVLVARRSLSPLTLPTHTSNQLNVLLWVIIFVVVGTGWLMRVIDAHHSNSCNRNTWPRSSGTSCNPWFDNYCIRPYSITFLLAVVKLLYIDIGCVLVIHLLMVLTWVHRTNIRTLLHI